MGKRKTKMNNQEFEILEHEPIPGYKTAFHIILGIAVVYLIYIFSQSGGV